MMRDDAFFVGYGEMPRSLRRFHGVLAGALLLGAAALGGLIAGAQNDPGPAVWEYDRETSHTGVLRASPHPVLISSGRPLLIVNEGKLGAIDRVRAFDGRRVTVRGQRLSRDGTEMLELSPGEEVLRVLGGAAQTDSSTTPPAAPVTLRGEIVDSKCFLGAMKPGQGKTHKACATLCIRGGIPAMLVTWNDAGEPEHRLLVDENGQPLTGPALETLLPFVGDSVEVEGVEHTVEGVRTLRLGVGSIRRTP